MNLKLIKITVEAGLLAACNLPQTFLACACQDLDIRMRAPRTISVDSLGETERQRDRERQTERQRDREGERERERERERREGEKRG